MPIDDRTANFDLPKPNVLNIQTDDVARLRSALDGVDTALQSHATSIAAKADLVSGKVPAGQLPTPYSLPSATPSTLGGIKVGAGLIVTPDGEVSAVIGGSESGLPVFDELSITPDSNGKTVFTPAGGYDAGQIELFKNGVLQYGNGDDYTATNGTTFTLTVGANTTDTLLLRRWIYLPSSQAVNKTGDTMTGALNWAASVSVTSASTTNIGLAASNLVTINPDGAISEPSITSFGVIAAGVVKCVTFSGRLHLIQNATSLILPGAASITAAAGDAAVFESLGSGNWRCTAYQRANGGMVSADMVRLNSSAYILSGTSTVVGMLYHPATNGLTDTHVWENASGAALATLKSTGMLYAAGHLSNSGLNGYDAGAGGTVTQATSKSTAVALNKPSGLITMNAEALAAGASISFAFNNSNLSVGETLSFSVLGVADSSSYQILHGNGGSGYAYISVRNVSLGSLAEAVQIQFNVHKGARS